MINCIIVDDEHNLGKGLKRTIESRLTDLHVQAVCFNLEEAETALNKFHPELVFLDVELGNGQTSFDLLNKISPINFGIIFTTAHNQYAIQAIKFSAIDYLLKPIDEEELTAAVEKFRKKKEKGDAAKIECLLSALIYPGNQKNKIHLPTKTGYELIAVADIIYCRGKDNECLLTLINDREILITIPMWQFENLLTQYRFARIQHSYLLNLNHVKKYIKGKDGIAVVSNNANLTVSRMFKEKFIERLKAVV